MKAEAEISHSPFDNVSDTDPGLAKEEWREQHEIFVASADEGVNFRTVSWQRATIIFLKIQFAKSILAVPGAVATLGAVGGAISIVARGALNCYTALILGSYRNAHPQSHTLADMMGNIGGRFAKELVGAQILIAQVIIAAAGVVSLSTAFNALSEHGACTVVFSAVCAIMITMFSSIRTFSKLGWVTWFGFALFFAAVFVFVVAVTQQSRPAAAPQTGPYELGWTAIAYPTFIAGIVASLNLFIFGSGSSMYLPVISEMKKPGEYPKASLSTGVINTAMYLTFSLVIYRWCGVWISTPTFGSAGPLIKKISYGLAIPGLLIGTGIYQHIAAKLHLCQSAPLQADTVQHWGVWLGANLLLGVLGFIIAGAVPILNYLLGFAAALCFAPFSLIYPPLLWMADARAQGRTDGRAKMMFVLNGFIVALGLLLVVGGTYGVAEAIKSAYANGMIGRAFDCADNSASIS